MTLIAVTVVLALLAGSLYAIWRNHLRRVPASMRFVSLEPLLGDVGVLNLSGIALAITGGESGPGARPFDIAWARSIIKQCADAGVACFVKQLGAHPSDGWNSEAIVVNIEEGTSTKGCPASLCLQDRKGGDPAEWPIDLKVRDFPRVDR